MATAKKPAKNTLQTILQSTLLSSPKSMPVGRVDALLQSLAASVGLSPNWQPNYDIEDARVLLPQKQYARLRSEKIAAAEKFVAKHGTKLVSAVTTHHNGELHFIRDEARMQQLNAELAQIEERHLSPFRTKNNALRNIRIALLAGDNEAVAALAELLCEDLEA